MIEDFKSRSMEYRELETLRNTASKVLQALLRGDLRTYGSVMIENNEAQRSLHPDLIPEKADLILGIAKRSGALGWKVNGTGGSGSSMTVLLPDDPERIKNFKEDIENLQAADKCAGEYESLKRQLTGKDSLSRCLILSEHKNPQSCSAYSRHVCLYEKVVEVGGIEPPASGVQSPRSPY